MTHAAHVSLYVLRKALKQCPECGCPVTTTHIYCPICRAKSRQAYYRRCEVNRGKPMAQGANLVAHCQQWHTIASVPCVLPCCGDTLFIENPTLL